MSDTRAGQPSERTPDFIPGWFIPRPGNADTAEREAVRFIGTQDFPINFLRDDETVRMAKRPQLGVLIGPASMSGHDRFDLAVPPGYWIVRDAAGRPHLWTDEDFAAKWVRNNGRDWIAPVERGGDESLKSSEEPLSPAEIVAGSAPPEERPAWAGEPPAEGTRRKLILDTLEDFSARLISGVGGKLTGGSCLDAADAIEAALLGIDEREERRASMERLDVSAEESNSRGGRELHIVLGPNPDRRDPSSMVFFEIENEKGVSVGGFDRREIDGRTHIVIPVPYPVGPVGVKCKRGGTHAWPRNPRRDGRSCLKCGTFPEEAALDFRDDGWVSEVAYQCAGAATRPLLEDHPDYVFPAERVRDAVAELLKDFGIERACPDQAEERLEHGAKEVDGRRDDTIKSLTLRCDSLLAQRESARAGEDHFKAQRDSALHLVRWLIGDIIPPELIRLGDDAPEDES